MAPRQKGIPMAQVLDTLEQSGAGHLHAPMQAIVRDACSRSQPTAQADRQKAVQDFGAEAFKACTKTQPATTTKPRR